MSRKRENTGFTCAHCGATVTALTNGSYRNHCPCCLYSLHVDNTPGDRQSDCRGLMEPIRVTYSSKKGYQIMHRCSVCGTVKTNRIAEHTDMPDELQLLIDFMQKI